MLSVAEIKRSNYYNPYTIQKASNKHPSQREPDTSRCTELSFESDTHARVGEKRTPQLYDSHDKIGETGKHLYLEKIYV